MSRYERNFPAFTENDFEKIRQTKVCVVGCGGLGGYIIEMLTRIGIGSLILIDGDVFEESNLNRQLNSTQKNLGTSKAKASALRVKLINKDVNTCHYKEFLTAENGAQLIDDANIVIDALDNVKARLILQDLCKNKGIPLIHGAIGGWFAQITTVFPEDNTLSRLYSEEKDYDSKSMGNPSFTPALAASIQVSEALKVITDKEDLLRNQLLYIDLLSNEIFKFNI
ncbi:HesA/MoeB/ThiF family protein [Eubacteriaceae bacterium ES3]|nr:HesA/MoeB/ThiF family protein [Eubacteriaceae bacterium ES3]